MTEAAVHELRGPRNEAVPPRVVMLFFARALNDVPDGARPTKPRGKASLKTLRKLRIGRAE